MGEREITARSDVYALGCVLYEMLTGEPPFTGATAQAIVARVMTENPRPMLPQRHTIPPHVEAAVLTALEKLPADRFATAAEFAEALTDTGYAPRATARHGGGGRAGRRRLEAAVRGRGRRGRRRHGRSPPGAGARAQGVADQPTTWQYIALGDSVVPNLATPGMALSPDGSLLIVKDPRPERPPLGQAAWGARTRLLSRAPSAPPTPPSPPTATGSCSWPTSASRRCGCRPAPSSPSPTPPRRGLRGRRLAGRRHASSTSRPTSPADPHQRRGRARTVVWDNTGLQGIGFGYPHPLPGRARRPLPGLLVGLRHDEPARTRPQDRYSRSCWSTTRRRRGTCPSGHLLYIRRDGMALVAPFDLGRLGAHRHRRAGVRAGAGAERVRAARLVAVGSVVYASGREPEQRDGDDARLSHRRPDRDRLGLVGAVHVARALPRRPPARRRRRLRRGDLNIWIKQLDRGPVHPSVLRRRRPSSGLVPGWTDGGLHPRHRRHQHRDRPLRRRQPAGPTLARLDRQVQEVEWSRDGQVARDAHRQRQRRRRRPRGQAAAGRHHTGAAGGEPVHRAPPGGVPGRPVACLHLERVGKQRGVRAALPQHQRRPLAGVHRRRPGAALVRGTGGSSSSSTGAAPWSRHPSPPAPPSRSAPSDHSFNTAGFALDDFHQAYDVSPDGRSFIIAAPRQFTATARPPQLVRVDHWFRDLEARLKQ